MKKGKKLWSAVFSLFAVFALVISFRMPLQAAENVTNIDMSTANGLWNITQSWDSINRGTNLSALDVSGLSVKTQNGAFVYVEAPAILAYPDTTSWIRATYQNIGTIGGRSVSVQIFFQSFHGKKDTDPNCGLNGNAELKPYLDPERSAVVLSTCFWDGFSQHAIHGMEEDYHFYFTDTGEAISCKGAYMTANSLNNGESIRYMTEGQDGGNLNTYVRSDHLLRQREFGWWEGTSDAFTDDSLADDYTRASVCFQLCTDDPKFMMWSDTNDFWHAYTVSPLGATLPCDPQKVGYTKTGAEVNSLQDVNIGDVLQFDVKQKVETIGVTGSIKYRSFVLMDILPKELTYDSANVTDEYGNLLNDSQVKITVDNGTVKATFADDYLQNGMRYAGETYHFHVAAKVNDNAITNSNFQNQGCSIVNGTKSSMKIVNISVKQPNLTIEKSADRYEYQVGDEVTYRIKVSQTNQGAVAKNVVISDTSLPSGIAISNANDAISVSTSEHYTVERQGNGFNVKMDTLRGQAEIKIKCTAKQDVNGKEITNTATASAANAKQVKASAKVYINSPKLSIEKSTDQFEHQVGDNFAYHIKVAQTEHGCQARNVVISDTSLPGGLAISNANDAISVSTSEHYTIERQGNGFSVKLDTLHEGQVDVRVVCTAKQEVNGKVITNTATASGANVKSPVQANARVYINSPKFAIEKNVSKYEWHVGDTIDYTIHLRQTESGCQAKNVIILDETLPDGLAISNANDAVTVNYPEQYTDRESGQVRKTAESVERRGNGFGVRLDRLESDVTVKVKAIATEAVNGKEIINTVTASGDNVKTPVQANAKVYINSPGVKITKECDKSYAKPGDVISYSLDVHNRTVGTLAHNIVIEDEIKTDGLKLQKNSIVVLDSEGNLINADVSIKGNSFKIKTGNTLVCDEGNYEIVNKAVGNSDGGKLNPDGVTKETVYTVEYQASATKKVEEGGMLKNIASVTCDEGTRDEDEATIGVDGAVLEITKTSDKGSYQVNETGHYKLTIRQTRESLTAKDVMVTDCFEKTGMHVDDKSIKISLNGAEFSPEEIKMEADGNGFTIKTGKNLTDTDKLMVTYDVLFDSVTVGEKQVNTAKAFGSNVNEVKESNEIMIGEGESPILAMDKVADKKEVHIGDTVSYDIKVWQYAHYVSADNVVIKDSFEQKGASYVKDSFKVTDTNGKDITEDVTIFFVDNGFTIKTGKNLGYNDFFKLHYKMTFEDDALGGQTFVNHAIGQSDNTEDISAVAEVKVVEDAPELSVKKKAEKEKVHVGDHNTYKITVTQTKEGEIAKNITIRDVLSEEGVSYVKESLVIKDDTGKDITKDVGIKFEDHGFTIETGKDLSYKESLTVTYDVKYESRDLAGKSVKNIVVAKTDNGKDNETPGETTVDVIPDEPELSVVKQAEKDKVRVGENNTYRVTITQTKEGEIAKNVTISDKLSEAGVSYVKESLKVKDRNGKDITENVNIFFEERGFVIKTGKDLAYKESLTVTYDVKYESEELAGKSVQNTVVAKAENGNDIEPPGGGSTVDVIPDEPELLVKKKAEKESVRVGEDNTYKITVTQTKEGETAKNVVIHDMFSEEGISYVKESLKVKDDSGKDITNDVTIIFEENSFTIKTKKDLAYKEYLTVTYDVKYESEKLAGKSVKNTVVAKSDNGKDDGFTGDSTVDVILETPEIEVTKKAAKKTVSVGEKNTYTIEIKQTKKDETARNIVIHDVLSEGASYVKDSFVITDMDGHKLTGIKGSFENNSFTIKTGKDLTYDKGFILTYKVTYDSSAAGHAIKNTVTVTADNCSGGTTKETTVEVKEKMADTTKSSKTPTETKQKTTSTVMSAPQTGLHDNILLYAISGVALIVAGVGSVVHLLRKRKKKK